MSGTTPGVVGSISETADSTLGLELTVSGITPQVAVSVADSEDADYYDHNFQARAIFDHTLRFGSRFEVIWKR